MKICGIVVAAGSGLRAGSELPKQYVRLAGPTILARSINIFLDHPEVSDCIAVIANDHRDHFRQLVEPELRRPVSTVSGGATRMESVISGLRAVTENPPSHVLIHDGARPLASAELVSRVIEALHDGDASVPVLPVHDSLWRHGDGYLADPVPRSNKCRAQTPQGFDYARLVDAHEGFDGHADDDAAIARSAGMLVTMVDGEPDNVKVTIADDVSMLRRLLSTEKAMRVGSGHDVHRLVAGDGVTLCGVRIPFDRSLSGHSDADVAAHAIADAVYGAIGEGDIGTWFPPDDPAWKDADSMMFLEHASRLASRRGYRIVNIDCTIICELPKIAPHAEAMKARLADILGIPARSIGVKATTTEGLGFPGRGEGIAAHALATLVET